MDEQKPIEQPKPRRKKNSLPLALKVTAKVMTESGLSQRETARELGVTLATVQDAIRNQEYDHSLVEKAKQILPSKLYQVAFMLADRLQSRPELVEKMNPYMCALVMGIMIDKARLMSGQSTENVAVKGTVAEIQTTLQKIAEMKARLNDSPKGDQNEKL